MEYKYAHKYRQDDLKHDYENAKARTEYNKEYAKEQRKILNKCTFVDKKEALEKAIEITKEGNYDCKVWAKIKKDEEYYYIDDLWLVTTDVKTEAAAEYLGLAILYVYDNLLQTIDEMKVNTLGVYLNCKNKDYIVTFGESDNAFYYVVFNPDEKGEEQLNHALFFVTPDPDEMFRFCENDGHGNVIFTKHIYEDINPLLSEETKNCLIEKLKEIGERNIKKTYTPMYKELFG